MIKKPKLPDHLIEEFYEKFTQLLLKTIDRIIADLPHGSSQGHIEESQVYSRYNQSFHLAIPPAQLISHARTARQMLCQAVRIFTVSVQGLN